MNAGNFQGAKFSQASSDLDSVLQVVGVNGLEIYNSVFDSLPASLRIASGSVQVSNSNFTNIQGNTAGGLIIDQAVVDVSACKFSNDQSQSGETDHAWRRLHVAAACRPMRAAKSSRLITPEGTWIESGLPPNTCFARR